RGLVQGELGARPERSADRKEAILADPCMATYLDVSVLRCLFISQWLEEGVHWALQFLLNRHRRLNRGDLRAFVEERLRLSERILDRLGRDDDDRPKSALGLLRDMGGPTDAFPRGEMVRGKSLPSIHIEEPAPPGPEEEAAPSAAPPAPKAGTEAARKLPAVHTHSVPNPIITVTEHSPVASIQFFINQDSAESPKEETPPSAVFVPPCHQLSITRSQTDSNILYSIDDFNEASGSTHYITLDGRINLFVVLKAVHAVTLRETSCSLRVCGALVSILELLLGMDVLPRRRSDDPWEDLLAPRPDADRRSDQLSTHNLFVDSIVR
ncbi:unnamed protein product, partial [Ixodes pacificus]